MNYKVLPIAAIAALSLSACKIEVKVPDNGRVQSQSGAYTCTAGNTCYIDVLDLFFDETFEAIPENGYSFSRWANGKEGGALCGNTAEPCRVYSAPLESNADLMAILESDQAFALKPLFEAEPCDLAGVNTDTNRAVFLDNGMGAGYRGNQFDDPERAIDWLEVRDKGCGASGDPHASCSSAGDATGVRVSACNVVHNLVVADTSTVEIDRGVVLAELRMVAESRVIVDAGDVREGVLFGSSRLALKGGEVGAIHALESSEVAVTGGITRDLEALDSARIRVTGGKVNSITAFDNGRIAIEGGDLRVLDGGDPYAGYLEAQGAGEIVWSGGRTGKGQVGNREDGNLILTFGAGKITIRGRNFTWSNAAGDIVDKPLPYGRLPRVVGWLSGTLANGDTLTDVFWEQKAGTDIILAKPAG